MASKQPSTGDGIASQIAGMSKPQLYEIMSHMKVMIEQNREQARQVLIDNPLLTRMLFQAQMTLGMVQPPKVIPNIQQTLTQPQPSHMERPPNVQATQSSAVQVAQPVRNSSPQLALPPKQQLPAHPSITPPSSSVPPLTLQPQSMSANLPQSAQVKAFSIPQMSSAAAPHMPNMTLTPPPTAPQYSALPSHMPVVPGQMQQPLQAPGIFNQQLQPPLPLQPRPPSIQPFPHQIHSQMPHGLGFQPSSAPQQLLSQPLFRSGNPPSFPQGKPPLPSQPPPQQLYQGGPHIGADYNTQAGISMQTERVAPWVPSHLEISSSGSQLPRPQLASGQVTQGVGAQPPRPPPMTPEMEKALLQQVMSLTNEQINLLPPEQRQQVLQLKEMLR